MANLPLISRGCHANEFRPKNDKVGECFGKVARKAPKVAKSTTTVAIPLVYSAPPPAPSAFRFVVVVVVVVALSFLLLFLFFVVFL